jgi:hypothetical protein
MAVQSTNMEANTPADTEKNTSTVLNSKEVLEDATAYDTDAASSDKQDGIKQVEAITTIWSKQMLIVTFVLYVQTPHYHRLLPRAASSFAAFVY